MPKAIVILNGHPDSAKAHLCHALAERYARAATAAGHGVQSFDIADLDFPVLRRREDWMEGPTPPALMPAQKAILAAEHIVIVYPLWLGTMPALLKAFLEQVLRPSMPGVDPDNPLGWRRLLKGCSARIIITMGMPGFVYRWFYGAHSLKSLERNILAFTGVGPVRSTLIGMVDNPPDARIKGWFRTMDKLGTRAR